MAELELIEKELEAMDVRAVMSIEISDIWLEMRTAEQNQDHERMAAAIARLEPSKLQLARPRLGTQAALSSGVPQEVSIFDE
jgi:hypothetical protein